MFRNVLVHFVKVFARQSNNQLGILFHRSDQCIQESRPMLYRCIQFRPSARTVVSSRGRRISSTQSARGLEFRISTSVINRRNFIMQIIQTIRQRRLRSAHLPLQDNSACLICLQKRLSNDFKGSILCVRHHRIQIDPLFGMSNSESYSNVNDTKNRMNRIFRAISNLFR